MAEVMPGISSKGTPRSARASSSSPPRPNTKGSPPFRRTTLCPARASSSRMRLICSWGTLWWEASLPTSMARASGGIMARMAGLTRRSYTTTSAPARASRPFKVSRPGSPGPAPTSVTFPPMMPPPSAAGPAPPPGQAPVPGDRRFCPGTAGLLHLHKCLPW